MRTTTYTRKEAELRLFDLVKLIDHAFEEVARLKTPNIREPKYNEAQRDLNELLRERREIHESGIIPWFEVQGISSKNEDTEIWCARMKADYYVYEDDDHRKPTKEWERSIIMTVLSSGYRTNTRLTQDEAVLLRDQLIYELASWDET